MNTIGSHFQNNMVLNWPTAVAITPPLTWHKIIDDVGMARNIKQANPQASVLMRFWRDPMMRFFSDREQTRAHAHDFIGTWLNESFMEALPYIDAVEDYNEYYAVSQTPDEVADRILWTEVLLEVWETQIVPPLVQTFPSLQERILNLRWCIGNTAIGNDIPWQVAHEVTRISPYTGLKRNHYLGYHPYISVYKPNDTELAKVVDLESAYVWSKPRATFRPRHKENTPYQISHPWLALEHARLTAQEATITEPTPGERSPQEFQWGSGRHLYHDDNVYAPRGIKPVYLGTEGGLVRDFTGRGLLGPTDGWKNITDLANYTRILEDWSNDVDTWNRSHNYRFQSAMLFNSAAAKDGPWASFDLNTNELTHIFTQAKATFPVTKPTTEENPPMTDTRAQGLDVSHWQGTINFDKAAAAGISFAYIKATEGTNYVDPKFAENTAKATAAGILVGAYHFFRANLDPILQARHFAHTIINTNLPHLPQNLPPVIDFETLDGMTSAEAAANLAAMHRELTARLLDIVPSIPVPLIYTNLGYLNNHVAQEVDAFKPHQVWIAAWNDNTELTLSVPWTWLFWQYTSKGSGPQYGATSKYIDLNRFKFSKEDLLTIYGSNWLQGDAPTPPPPPPPPEPVRIPSLYVYANVHPDDHITVENALLLMTATWPGAVDIDVTSSERTQQTSEPYPGQMGEWADSEPEWEQPE